MPQNREVWDRLYRSGRARMEYPSEALVRLIHRTLSPETHPRVMDLGFGSGNNLEFLVKAGFECHGVEVSPRALELTTERLGAVGADVSLHLASGDIPHEDGFFDAVICWLTLYYNDGSGVQRMVQEMARVLRPGGLALVTLARPEDVLVTHSEPVGDGAYRVGSGLPSQEGAVVFVPEDEAEIAGIFSGFQGVEIGHFDWSYGGILSAHWMIVAER